MSFSVLSNLSYRNQLFHLQLFSSALCKQGKMYQFLYFKQIFVGIINHTTFVKCYLNDNKKTNSHYLRPLCPKMLQISNHNLYLFMPSNNSIILCICYFWQIFLCLFNFIGGTIKYRQRLGREISISKQNYYILPINNCKTARTM